MSNYMNISDSILIAVASGVSYAVAFSYQTGFASYFGLPPLLLSPTIGTVLKAATVIGAAILLFFIIANAIWQFVPRGVSALSRSIRRLIIIVLMTGLLAFQISNNIMDILLPIIILIFFVFFDFVFPLIVHRGVNGYENKLIAQESIEKDSHQHSLIGHVAGTLGYNPVRIVAIIVLLIYFSHLVGVKAARDQREFFILTDRPNYIVAAIDENIVVLANYDQTKSALTGTYQVERLSDSRTWTLQMRHIGNIAAPPKDKRLTKQSGP